MMIAPKTRFQAIRLQILAFILLVSATPSFAQTVDFSRDVRPIFNEFCVSCHGGVKQASNLSFIYRDSLIKPAKSGEIPVLPNYPLESELIARITARDPDDLMPPPDEHPQGLTDKQVDTLTRWIEQGAKWSSHWAFEKPIAQGAPKTQNAKWSRNTIDNHVLANLENFKITPAPDETPTRWLRRVSLDLVGLPPTPEELASFLADYHANPKNESSYERVVDRLLASPRFGERWASVWLDQIRYADSRGLGQDGKRNIWKYRDWVINSYNNDLPYDQFTIKQIAGDLKPNPTIDDLVATAVHRVTQSNEEGGTDDEEFRIAAVIDRVTTTWQSFQGLTFGCVQCHSHPYDPFTHEEFYKFAAFFNNTTDTDLNEDWPLLDTPIDPADYSAATELDRKARDAKSAAFDRQYPLLTDTKRWRPLTSMTVATSNATQAKIQTVGPTEQYHTVGTVTSNTDFTLEAPVPDGLNRITALRVTAMPLNPESAIPDSEIGFALSHIEASLIVPGQAKPTPISFKRIIVDELDPFLDPYESLNDKSKQGFAAYSRIHYPRQAAFIPEAPIDVPDGASVQVILKHRIVHLSSFFLIIRRGSLDLSSDTAFTDLNTDAPLLAAEARLAEITKERKAIKSTTTPILRERPDHLARPTHVFNRGLFLTKKQRVTPGTPGSLPPLPEGPADRMALAKWLVSDDNPLTARVAVNRYWARLFGIGLVETEEDFGSSGAKPSHPALLDYLAVRFQHDYKWSTKKILREMVLSRTYRQSSVIRAELLERDPRNRLLARGPRHRLPAEMVRDQALVIAGLMTDKTFGPPTYPPIPEGVWKPFQGGEKWYTPKPGQAERYRRSVYTYTKRSIPYPMFASFDAPSREVCAPRRLRSNTPIQALMTLNDEAFAECAEHLGGRMAELDKPIEDQLAYGFRLATCRAPSQGEVADLLALYEPLAANPSIGSRAALNTVGSVLINLDEILTK